MIIITGYLKNITKYLQKSKHLFYPQRYHCKNCGYRGLIHRHGYYSRWLLSFTGVKRINILRLWCPCCKKTYSILPAFLIPYFQYSFDVVFLCLYMVYILKCSYTRTIEYTMKINPHLPLCVHNLHHFKKTMKHHSPVINMFFASYENFYYDMNDNSPEKVLEKVCRFILQRPENFNEAYYRQTAEYLFKFKNKQR